MSQTAKNSKTSRLLAIAAPTLALGGMLAAAVPAQAMISDQFAEDSVHANAVVSEQIGDDGDEDGNCTGTAVADYWVVTARHCLENSETPGGSVRIGQGDDQKRVKVADWYKAPAGDIGLIRTAEPIGLKEYPEIMQETPAEGAIESYGWSSEGTGKTEKLPKADGKITELNNFALFGGDQAAIARLDNDSEFQQGDSGGPVFMDGKLYGVLSAAFNPDDPESTTSPESVVAPAAESYDWMIKTMTEQSESVSSDEANVSQGGGNTSADSTTSAAGESADDSSNTTWWLLGGGAVLVALVVGLGIVRKPKK